MTRANAAVGGMTLMIGLVAIAGVLPRAQTSDAAKPAAGALQGAAPSQSGRGGGDANPTAALYTEQCSGCHGTDLAGGRAPSLFDEKWLASTTDERIANAIRNGVPNTAMVPFKNLSDEQIWQLTQYMRAQSGVMKTRPAFVVNLDGAVMFDVQVHPRYAANGWIYLSYAELLPGYTPAAAPAAGTGRGGPVAPSMTAIVRGRLKNNEWVDQQFIYHAPPALYTTDGSHFGRDSSSTARGSSSTRLAIAA